ncbi:YdeI/OmpD-associated family protein [Schleiferia thermophila]|uniref:Uncharacterized protein YdeI (YjbR/CyaY-like superfamily) n=1 Tax=Schleiferia thermophila TaxID=884107 RepID=A0A369A3P9_9FLAO|nr:DUF1801 domain-containing protein [Schleiferia thermophila]RCX03859.1 uncharacterized protein YdeI (YjbR/CyaY-like superfamily) [Schleiferia thermophila]GCD80091.1 hypothetical protein JCM30197_13380 [Schleiferia thermophila]
MDQTTPGADHTNAIITIRQKPESADEYLAKGCGRCNRWNTPQCSVQQHHSTMKALIELMRQTGLREVIKWGVPCYTYREKNIAIVGAFRQYCSLSFFKGAMLEDEIGILKKPGENTQLARAIHFCSEDEVQKNADHIRNLVHQAILLEENGKQFEVKSAQLPKIAEWEEVLQNNPELRTAFEKLTPGKQKAYLISFSNAKTIKRRTNRIQKSIPLILRGEGLHDRYSGSR